MSSTAEATTLAAAGMGRPVNVYFCTPVAWTLKRARRKAPQMTKTKAANQPKGLSERNAHVYRSHPGAIPKDRRSARESYSTPKALEEPVKRATLPSRQSSPAARQDNQGGMGVLTVMRGNHTEKAADEVCRRKKIRKKVFAFFHAPGGSFRKARIVSPPLTTSLLVPLSLPRRQ